MLKSESIAKISKALNGFQADIKNPSNTANNPFFKSKYSPLNEVLNTVRPVLAKHGLSIVQSPASDDGQNISVTTTLLHESGEWIETEPLMVRAEKATAQGAGSVITYLRRYSLSAVLGISSEDDDDGNHAEIYKPKTQVQPARPVKPNPKQVEKMTDDRWANFWLSISELGFEDDAVFKIAGVSEEELVKFSPAQVGKFFNQLKKESANNE